MPLDALRADAELGGNAPIALTPRRQLGDAFLDGTEHSDRHASTIAGDAYGLVTGG
jgi:hypothetical protein